MTKPLGVILAGGLATRMGGGDKGLLPLGGQPLLGHVIDRLAPQVSGLALNANGDPARFNGFGLPVLPDTVEGFAGPLAGVLAESIGWPIFFILSTLAAMPALWMLWAMRETVRSLDVIAPSGPVDD